VPVQPKSEFSAFEISVTFHDITSVLVL